MNASMRNAYAWAVSRTLSNGTATLGGTSNNLLSTSLVGRVLTYIQLEIGDKTSLALIQQMINAEHTLLQNPSYISFGIWPVQDHLTQLQIHRDVQKFLLRAYGLTLDQTARSDLVMVTQDIYLNMPGRFEYYDTLAWGFANAVWFAFYDGSPLPSSSDFSSAVQDLNLHYNFTAAKADSANSFVDFSRLLHYITAPEFTDGYFRLEGLSLDQSYQSVEAQLADQLITRQLPNGNVSTIKPYKSYLVEDYAKDLDSAYYLNKDAAYVLAAFKTESFLTRLYLQPNGNMSLPGRGEGLAPFVSFHLISIANDIKLSSTSSWYVALSQASRIINYTMSIQNSDGTFRFYTNSTNPGFAYTTISATAAIADSYAVLQNSGVIATSTSQSSSSVSATSQLTFSVSTTSQPTPSFSASSGGVTASSATISQSVQSTSGNHQLTQSNPAGAPLSGIPSWAYALVPILLVIVLAMAYEARHRARYRGLVDK
jgi:hypothetical protein